MWFYWLQKINNLPFSGFNFYFPEQVLNLVFPHSVPCKHNPGPSLWASVPDYVGQVLPSAEIFTSMRIYVGGFKARKLLFPLHLTAMVILIFQMSHLTLEALNMLYLDFYLLHFLLTEPRRKSIAKKFLSSDGNIVRRKKLYQTLFIQNAHTWKCFRMSP